MLVGMKMDLRHDARAIGELMKEGKSPVTTKEVRLCCFQRRR